MRLRVDNADVILFILAGMEGWQKIRNTKYADRQALLTAENNEDKKYRQAS
jgi:hypothetical protein